MQAAISWNGGRWNEARENKKHDWLEQIIVLCLTILVRHETIKPDLEGQQSVSLNATAYSSSNVD